MTGAADMFHSITALNLEADAAGFELSEEDQAQLDAIAQSLDATADYYGMESGLAYLQASFGPKATVEDYVAFARDNLRASRYLEKLMDEMEFTDAEISDYYDQNADTYAENRVEKIDKPMVNVRHILVMPAEQNEDGTYGVKEGKYVAQIGDVKYETLEEAFAAAKNGDTITLLSDVDLDEQIATGKAITIDGQGKYTIKATKKLVGTSGKAGMFYRTTSAQGTLTFLNVTLDGKGVSKIFLNEGGAGETVFDGVTSINGGGIAYGSGIHISIHLFLYRK